MVNECQDRLIKDEGLLPGTVSSNFADVFFLGGGRGAARVALLSGQLPSFMLIKHMPNCIEGIFWHLNK